MSALYEKQFPGLRTTSCWKVVECVEEVRRSSPVEQLGVLCVEVEFALNSYRESDLEQKKRVALSSLHAGAMRAAAAQGWDLNLFEVARSGCLARNLDNAWDWPPRVVWNKNRSIQAHVECRHRPDYFSMQIVASDKNGLARGRSDIARTEPDEFFFRPLLGALKWKNGLRVVLVGRDGVEGLALDTETRS
ncbi:MAG: hypothetical protein KBG28_09520 [Kofleriaceae bacterium]|nr:hypothetical protein [Kofleriaceae bacterium]